MLCHAKAVIDRAIAARCIQPGRGTQVCGWNLGDGLQRFGAVAVFRNKGRPILKLIPVAAVPHKGFVDQPLGDDGVRHGRQNRDIGAGAERQMVLRLNMRGTDKIGAARINDNQLGPLAQPPLHPAGKDGVTVRRVGADDEDDVCVLYAVKILRARRRPKGRFQTIARGGVADTCARIDIVVAKARADQFLDEESFLIGAAGRRDAAQRIATIFGADPLEFGCCIVKGLIPADFTPRIADRGADHGV